MTTHTNSKPLDFLIENGKHLSELRIIAKADGTRPDTPIKVQNIVTTVLKNLNNASLNTWLAKESVDKLLLKIGAILLDFIKHDPNNKSRYEDITREIGSLQYGKQASGFSPVLAGSLPNPSDPLSNAGPSQEIEQVVDLVHGKQAKDFTSALVVPLINPNDPSNVGPSHEIEEVVDLIHGKQAMGFAFASGASLLNPGDPSYVGPSHEIEEASIMPSTYVVPPPNTDDSDEFNYDVAYEKLNGEEKECLRCLMLFPVEAEIKKREIVHLWIGMGLIKSGDQIKSGDGKRQLAKLVALGLIDRIFVNKKLLNYYKLSKSVYDKLQPTQPTSSLDTKKDVLHDTKSDEAAHIKKDTETKTGGTWSYLQKENDSNKQCTFRRTMTLINHPNIDDKSDPTLSPDEKVDPEALLNVDQTTLNAARLKTIIGMKNLTVVHLGSWRQDATKYIVVDDMVAFKDLKDLTKTRFLSLEGVSGMVELPKHVYDLKELEILDLRGCNNLERFPKGIPSLLQLTHLDLSGCYLLDNVPLGITKLTRLQVLKGFIINTEELSEKRGKGKNKQEQGKQTEEANKKEKQRKIKLGNSPFYASPCPFEGLSKLTELSKLTILTRRMDFPTRKDFLTFSQMEKLSCLRITWVGNSTKEVIDEVDGTTFPPTLMKLEFQAASDHIASRLLRLISEDKDNYGLEKLYIKGGGLKELKHCFPHQTVVRLRYLPQLQIDWDDFRKLFPNLNRLEVLECPNLILFPCDENGAWENTESTSDDNENED